MTAQSPEFTFACGNLRIARIALDVPVAKLFDYRIPESLHLAAGDCVWVPFGRSARLGIVVGLALRSELPLARLRSVLGPCESVPRLGSDWLGFMSFLAQYYQRPFGQVAAACLPPRLRRAQPLKSGGGESSSPPLSERPRFLAPHPLTEAQRRAVDRIASAFGRFQPFLLHGVTGSGKTEVYLHLISLAIARGCQALLLVPEIGLTPQLEARVRSAFPAARIALLHSGLQARPRSEAWLAAARGEAEIVLGTRLAVLAPMPRLGFIAVDEEHDSSFKQQEGLRYSARDAAVARARAIACPVVLGSATPALETWHNALAGRYERIELPERAAAGARLPEIRTVDLRADPPRAGIAPTAIEAIATRLAAGEQSLVFVNRRGYAPVVCCDACGWAAGCRRCSAHLVLHAPPACLRCHHCGAREAVPRACPVCGNVDLRPAGRGTQRVEEALLRLFPRARVIRFDRDSARRRRHFALTLEAVRRGEGDILVGTQLLAKGHDFPALTLVVVLDADRSLRATDYRAPERLFATLLQVAGRAGRRDQPGLVLVQTRLPGHPLYAALAAHDYAAFAATQLEERRAAGFPPFVHEALLRAEADSLEAALSFLRRAARLVPVPPGVRAYDPVPRLVSRKAGRHRAQLLFQSDSRPRLQRHLAALGEALGDRAPGSVRWHWDVDPIELE